MSLKLFVSSFIVLLPLNCLLIGCGQEFMTPATDWSMNRQDGMVWHSSKDVTAHFKNVKFDPATGAFSAEEADVGGDASTNRYASIGQADALTRGAEAWIGLFREALAAGKEIGMAKMALDARPAVEGGIPASPPGSLAVPPDLLDRIPPELRPFVEDLIRRASPPQ